MKTTKLFWTTIWRVWGKTSFFKKIIVILIRNVFQSFHLSLRRLSKRFARTMLLRDVVILNPGFTGQAIQEILWRNKGKLYDKIFPDSWPKGNTIYFLSCRNQLRLFKRIEKLRWHEVISFNVHSFYVFFLYYVNDQVVVSFT